MRYKVQRLEFRRMTVESESHSESEEKVYPIRLKPDNLITADTYFKWWIKIGLKDENRMYLKKKSYMREHLISKSHKNLIFKIDVSEKFPILMSISQNQILCR